MRRSILLPLQTLEEGTHRIGEGDLFHRVVIESGDEIGRLGRSFNAMAEKLERGQATLENLSVHDGLTGLFNYREFRRRLKEEADRSRRYGRPFSLLLLDLDHFKVINDTHGHQAGDEVLRAMANLISQGVRPVDKVARYGGEEIALILPETPGGKALIVAERVRSLVANHPVSLSTGTAVTLTCSIGVGAFGEDGASDNEIIGAADSALYAAKHAGRNRVCRLEKA
jgi:diguanylate cyclase (GGDEF)-like protein